MIIPTMTRTTSTISTGNGISKSAIEKPPKESLSEPDWVITAEVIAVELRPSSSVTVKLTIYVPGLVYV